MNAPARPKPRSGEAGCVKEFAHAVSNVVEQLIHRLGPQLSLEFSDVVSAQVGAELRDVSESLRRQSPRVLGRVARGDVVTDAGLDVESELVVDVAVDVGSPEAEVSAPGGHERNDIALP